MMLIDKVKLFWNRRPCNIKHSKKEVGTIEYFDDVENKKYFVEHHILYFAEFAKWKNKKVLEIGCGIGTDAINFARSGAEIDLVDVSKSSLDICKQRFSTYGLKANFFCGNAEKLSIFLPIKKYDLIYSFGVIHHTPQPEKVFKEIKKYCHKNTEIRIMLYSRWSWKVFQIVLKSKRAFWKTSEIVRQYSEAQEGSPITFIYSFRELKKLLNDFKVIEIKKTHIFPYKVSDYINHKYEKVWYFKTMPKKIFNFLERKLGWHILIKMRIKDE